MIRVITEKNGYVLNCLTDGSKAAELRVDPVENDSCIGNIYIGRVRDVVPSVAAAFVDIDGIKNAFLPFSDLGPHTVFTKKNGKGIINCDDELLVMVEKEAQKTKPRGLTTKISLSGRYCALVRSGAAGLAFSKKISDGEWKNTVRELINFKNDDYALIVRTNAYNADTNVLKAEIGRLTDSMTDIVSRAPFFKRTGKPIYCAEPAWLTDIRDTAGEDSRIITDNVSLLDRIRDMLLMEGDSRVPELYTDPNLSLISAYSIRKAADEAISRIVNLKSGAYLVIEPTEALTVIDVNSGRYSSDKGREESYLKVNIEAAAEIARQLRLRNISGMIICDFINLSGQEDRDELLSKLAALLKTDTVKTGLAGISNLGLVEITRKKIRKPLDSEAVKTFIKGL